MNTHAAPRRPKQYKVGIDVGTHSVGVAAVEIDDAGKPLSLLSCMSHIHDSGVLVDKTGESRLAVAGTARRMRRLLRRRRARLLALDRALAEWGWPEPDASNDPHAPWHARARLASAFVEDEHERRALLVRALRHIARHRGWRNPYVTTASLYHATATSDQFHGFRERVEQNIGRSLGDGATVGQLAAAALLFNREVPLRMGKTANTKMEKSFSYLGGKLMQQDNAAEVLTIARTQRLDDALTRTIIDLVFAAESPRGSWLTKIGKDPLAPGSFRAPKASDAFQRFRIASVLANVRIAKGGEVRALTIEEKHTAFAFLESQKPDASPTWTDVAKHLGFSRGALAGPAALDEMGEERLPARPPVHVVNGEFLQKKSKLPALYAWWTQNDGEHRDALIALIADGIHDDSTESGAAAWELLNSMDEDALGALENLSLPAGRASYSAETLRRLTQQIMTSDDDLHAARKRLFNVDDSWVPPAEPINAPVGHPTVDRVTKIVGRWLAAAEAQWGAPVEVTLEHVREAFASEAMLRKRDKEMQKRFSANDVTRRKIRELVKDDSRVRTYDVRRYDAITRQNCQCAYCGDQISFTDCEMDHIVPRKGPGSTNTRSNLVAVCIRCNRSKGNIPFAVWAERSTIEGVSVREAVSRTKHWIRDTGPSPKAWRKFLKEVTDRLERTDEDPEIDARSMESVAWMANELHSRIAEHFRAAGTRVRVFQGAVTAGARQASGIAKKIEFIGGGGKTRLDRRHHAVDAAVVAILDNSVARTLAERNSMRTAERFPNDPEHDWRNFTGATPAARERFATWVEHMHVLAKLINRAFADERVIVTERLRLRLGNGAAHEATVRPLIQRAVGDAFTRDEIDAASIPQLYTALVRDPDFDEKHGLPPNPNRTLRVKRDRLTATDTIGFFSDKSGTAIKPQGAIAVRGGFATLGAIHHARLYRWQEKGKTKHGMLRVYAADLIKHRREDVFAVTPDPSWISMRRSLPAIGRAPIEEKEYIGWLVPGDAVRFDSLAEVDNPDLSDSVRRDLERLVSLFGPVNEWRVSGFEDDRKVNLAPALIAKEGLESLRKRDNDEGVTAYLDAIEAQFFGSNFWRLNLGNFVNMPTLRVTRRDVLGRSRRSTQSHLPTSYALH